MSALPLQGLRVVALEQAVSAPFCSRQLADMGTDVIKVERPDGGDFARSYDGALHGLPAYFAWLNRGKCSIVLDLKRDEDRATFSKLIAHADVFIHNLAPVVLLLLRPEPVPLPALANDPFIFVPSKLAPGLSHQMMEMCHI